MRDFCLALLVLFASGLSAMAQSLGIGDEPGWVDVLAVPEGDPALRAEVEAGQFFLLSDHQMRWEGDVAQSYARTTAEVTDRAGLEELATIQIDFDPEFETVELVRLVILRDGQEIDLKSVVTPQVYRRETRLDEGIIDGTLTAVVQVPDLRVGDVVDYASILTRRPFLAGVEFAGTSLLEWGTPVVLSRTVLNWPADRPLELAPLPPEVIHSVLTQPDGTLRHEWRREGHIPPPEEDSVPYEVTDGAMLRFADTRDWTALAVAISPHYLKDYPLPAAWVTKVDAIAATHATPAARAFAALRLVQDDLRYVSLSVGAGGYLARTPEEVIATGFGDCKDKSLLLRVILTRLGIPAWVALTDLDAGHGLPEELPSLWVFDHMILKAKIDGKVVWMDPTGTHAGGGIDTAAALDYGFALPLSGQAPADLEPMEPEADAVWKQVIHEDYAFSLAGVVLTVETVNLTGAADSARARWATTPVSQISERYLGYYLDRYPGLVALGPTEMSDDRAGNRVVETERYFLPAAAFDKNGLREDFAFGPSNLVEAYPERLDRPRRLPFLVSGPWVVEHEVTVKGAPIEFEPPEALVLSNPAFEFSYSGQAVIGGNMKLAWRFSPKVHAIAARDVEAVLQDADAVRENAWFSWDLTQD